MDGMQQEGMTQGCLDDCHEIYYVKEEALKLLLAGLGQTQWYGLFSEGKPHGSSVQENTDGPGARAGLYGAVQDKGLQEKPGGLMYKESRRPGGNEAVNSVLAGMYLDGLIDWEGKGVAVRQPYARMLSVMLEQKACVTCEGMDSLSISMLRCCYLSGDSVIAVRISQREDGMLGLAQLAVREWEQMLGEACARLADGECLEAARRSSVDGRIFREVRVWKAGIRDVWVERDGERRCLYAAENAGEVLGQMLGIAVR